MFDIIIIGGGPAGLVLASNIDQRFRVLLIEKNKIGLQEKYWVTTMSKTMYHNLSNAIVNLGDALIFKTYLGAKLIIPGKFVTLCEKKLLNIFLQKISKRDNVSIIDECEMYNFCWINGKIQLQTTKGNFSCSLLVDASGYKSRIVASYNLFIPLGYYVVYGATMSNVRFDDYQMTAAEIVIQGKIPTYLEIIPISHSETYVVVFQALRYYKEPFTMKELFNFHLYNTHYRRIFKNAIMKQQKFGVIPIGHLRSSALDNVFFWGDSGGYAFPILGTTLVSILDNYNSVTKFLEEKMRHNTLSHYHLAQFCVGSNQVKLFKILSFCFETMLSSNDALINELVNIASTLDNDFLYRIIDNRVSKKDLLEIIQALFAANAGNRNLFPSSLKGIFFRVITSWRLLKLWMEILL